MKQTKRKLYTIEVNNEILCNMDGNSYRFDSFEDAKEFIKENKIADANVIKQFGLYEEEENNMDNKLIIKLMDFTSTFTKEVEVNEGDEVEISIYTGDWVMESPVEVDTATDRLWDYYDGRVCFKATKNNVDKVNNCKSNYEILQLVFE